VIFAAGTAPTASDSRQGNSGGRRYFASNGVVPDDAIRAQSSGEVEARLAGSRGGAQRRRHSATGKQADRKSTWQSGRVVVADALPIFRNGVLAVLARETDLECAQAEDLDSLLSLCAEFRPEVVLIDLELPPFGGIEAVRRLTAAQPVHAIVWSFDPRPSDVFGAIRANASGYLGKDIRPDALVRVLRGVRLGEAPLPRSLTLGMIAELHDFEQSERAREITARLSRREGTVLDLVERSYSNKQIAAALFISEHTVKRHVQNILAKLAQSSRADAAAVLRSARAKQELELELSDPRAGWQ
jgi:DNA-binding NarL/FixJ family response regulator